MSRAIHKIRGGIFPLSILIEDLGNTSSVQASSVTFSAKAVGSGAGRTIIVMATIEDTVDTGAIIQTCTVDGTSTTRVAEEGHPVGGDKSYCAIFTLALTTENGNVAIGLISGHTPNSWGMSYLILSKAQSATPTDTATGDATNSDTVATTSSLDGTPGGIAVAVATSGSDSNLATWGSSLTEKVDVNTGTGGSDHRHTVAYDLLPSGRSASLETVNWADSTSRLVIVAATFR